MKFIVCAKITQKKKLDDYVTIIRRHLTDLTGRCKFLHECNYMDPWQSYYTHRCITPRAFKVNTRANRVVAELQVN
jgi:hypothetical protein